MSTLSLHLSPSAVARRAHRRGWFARFLALVQESRMRTARAEIARHRHLLPVEFELAGDRLMRAASISFRSRAATEPRHGRHRRKAQRPDRGPGAVDRAASVAGG